MPASLNIEAARPTDPGQGVDEGAAFDAECAADRRLGRAAVERRDDRGQVLSADRGGTAATTPPAPGGGETGFDALLSEGTFKLSQRSKYMKQELSLRSRGVHLFGQRTESDASCFKFVHRGQQMWQRAAETIQLPDDQTIARTDECQRSRQTGAISPSAAGVILEQMAFIHPGSQECVALQVQNLPVSVRGYAHIADNHVRKTPLGRFSYITAFRQGLSCIIRGEKPPIPPPPPD